VLKEVVPHVWSSSDWEDKIVAAGLGVGERPVVVVAGVPSALERQRQHSGVERHGRVHHVLSGVCCWLGIQRSSPAERATHYHNLI